MRLVIPILSILIFFLLACSPSPSEAEQAESTEVGKEAVQAFDFEFIKSQTSTIQSSIKLSFTKHQKGIDLEFIKQKLSKHPIDLGYPEYFPTDYSESYSFEGFQEYQNFNLFTITHQNEYCCNTLYAITSGKDSIDIISIAAIGFYGGDGEWHGEEYGQWVNDSTIETICISDYDEDLDEKTNNSEIDTTWITYTIHPDGRIRQLKTDSVSYIGNKKVK